MTTTARSVPSRCVASWRTSALPLCGPTAPTTAMTRPVCFARNSAWGMAVAAVESLRPLGITATSSPGIARCAASAMKREGASTAAAFARQGEVSASHAGSGPGAEPTSKASRRWKRMSCSVTIVGTPRARAAQAARRRTGVCTECRCTRPTRWAASQRAKPARFFAMARRSSARMLPSGLSIASARSAACQIRCARSPEAARSRTWRSAPPPWTGVRCSTAHALIE